MYRNVTHVRHVRHVHHVLCKNWVSKEGPSLYDRSSCDRNHRSRVVLLSLTLILIALLLHL